MLTLTSQVPGEVHHQWSNPCRGLYSGRSCVPLECSWELTHSMHTCWADFIALCTCAIWERNRAVYWLVFTPGVIPCALRTVSTEYILSPHHIPHSCLAA